VLKGRIQVHDLELDAGDGLAVSDEPSLLLKSVESAELMLFDLA
ncbi:MAG: pirin family protein, partial [Planctomycetales bacterium]|nr:pirin family protein [Planctomycetales bacterium]